MENIEFTPIFSFTLSDFKKVKPNLDICGIYVFTDLINNKQYVGQSIHIKKRINAHYHCKSDTCSILHKSILKNGHCNFTIGIMPVEVDKLDLYENTIITMFNTLAPNGYNLISGGNNSTRIVSEHTKHLLSKASKGRKLSEEHKKNISEGGKGKKHSTETKEKIRLGNLGRLISEETKEKLRNQPSGKKLSEEHKKKIGEGGKGRKLSEEHKEKIRQFNLGSKRSDETKQKLKDAWVKRREK